MPKKKTLPWWKSFGPGFITGASDDDPSGIGTYSQTGAQFGLHQLWLPLYTIPLMVVVQEMCGRIGLVTGRGLAAVLRKNYPRPILYLVVSLLLFANIVNIGANLGAMAASAQLVMGHSFRLWLFLATVISIALEVLLPYALYSRFLKYLTLSLLAYAVTAFIISQNWMLVLVSLAIPHIELNRAFLFNLVAMLGTTISPYLFFWQASQEVEEEVRVKRLAAMDEGKPRVYQKDLTRLRVDTIVGMIFSNLISFFIILTTSGTLNRSGVTTIESAQQAALALRPLAGEFAFFLFALGIIGTGLLSLPILAGSAAYALSEIWHKPVGLSRNLFQAPFFYGAIAVLTLLGTLGNFLPVSPFQLLYYTAVLNGLCAPVLLFFILLIANNRKILGRYTNTLSQNLWGWATFIVMGLASALLIGEFLFTSHIF